MSNVKDVKVKKFPVRLDGNDRTLVFDLNAFAEIEDAYGDIELAMQKMQAGSPKALRILLWAGLLHENEELTLKEVGKMLDMAGIQDLTHILVQGLGAHTPSEADQLHMQNLEAQAASESAPKQVVQSSGEPGNAMTDGTGPTSTTSVQ